MMSDPRTWKANKLRKLTGPVDHWLTTRETGFWGLKEKYRDSWNAFREDDVFIFHATPPQHVNAAGMQGGIVGAGRYSHGTEKTDLSWIGEHVTSENTWPLQMHFKEILWLGDEAGIDARPALEKWRNDQAALINDSRRLLHNAITFTEMTEGGFRIPAQGSLTSISGNPSGLWAAFLERARQPKTQFIAPEAEERRRWTLKEERLAVECYFRIMDGYDAGRPIEKAGIYREYLPRLQDRTRPSLELKLRNISAVLDSLGQPFAPGLVPATRVSTTLAGVIAAFLEEREIQVIATTKPEDQFTQADLQYVDAPAPAGPSKPPSGQRRGRKVDYAKQEAENRSRGLAGELLILEAERRRLAALGRQDLAENVEHTSVKHGDGLGYDIKSFTAEGTPLYIEVKTTSYGLESPFLMTDSELRFAKENLVSYELHRVFKRDRKPCAFKLTTKDLLACTPEPTEYRLRFTAAQLQAIEQPASLSIPGPKA